MHKRTKALCALGAFALAPMASAGVFEQELGLGALDEGFQVTDNGNPQFANAQGNDGDGFQEYYVMRFDLSAYGGAPVSKVEIDLRHEEIFFANSGGVSLTYSADDATDLSTLTFDAGTTGGLGTQLSPSSLVADFQFVDTPGVDDTTTIDTIMLANAGGFFSDIESQGVVTLVLQATDDFTAATYAGIGNNGGGPVLRVFQIPTPGAVALFGLAGLSGLRRRRA